MSSISTAEVPISRTYRFLVIIKEYQSMDDEHIAERNSRLSNLSSNDEDWLFDGHSSVISGLTHRICNERPQTGTALTHLVGNERNKPRLNAKNFI